MEKEPMQEGSWIVDRVYEGKVGKVNRLFPDGVTATFGKMVCIRKMEQIQLAPLDIRESDLKTMLDVALSVRDFDWAHEIARKMKEGVKG